MKGYQKPNIVSPIGIWPFQNLLLSVSPQVFVRNAKSSRDIIRWVCASEDIDLVAVYITRERLGVDVGDILTLLVKHSYKIWRT